MAPPIIAREERRVWSWPERAAYWLYGFFLHPFLKRHPDGSVTGEITYWAVAGFSIVEIWRLAPHRTADGWIVPPVGWPDVFLAFCILFAVPIDNALTKAAPQEVIDLLKQPFARAGDAIDQGAEVTTTLQQKVTPEGGTTE